LIWKTYNIYHELRIASDYRISEIKFEELIKIREKLASKDSAPDKLSKKKLGGQKSQTKMVIIMTVKFMPKLLPSIIYQVMIGVNQLLNICKIPQGVAVKKLGTEP